MTQDTSRRAFVALGLAAGATLATPARAAIGALERASLKLGLPVPGTSFLPIYVAKEKFWKANGLDIEIASFRGDSDVAQALAGGSVDLTVQSVDGLVNLIEAGQPIMAFYAGFGQADFVWMARPDFKSVADLQGRNIAVSTFGSLTEQLTRYLLLKNGLDPMKDAHVIQGGPGQARMQAMKSGRADAAIFPPPDKWIAEENGFNMVGSQARDIAPEWPKHVMLGSRDFIDKNPNTLKALLRSHVQAIRYARANVASTVDILVRNLKFPERFGERAYRDVIDHYNERGELPKSMDVFWKIMVESKVVSEPWPEAKFLDDRFIKTFDDWMA